MFFNHVPANGAQPCGMPTIGQALNGAAIEPWNRLRAFELAPTASRARMRDAIIQDQINSPARVWQQVGALLQGALAHESRRPE